MKRGRKPQTTSNGKAGTFNEVPTPPAYLDPVATQEYRLLTSILVEAGTLPQTDPKLIEMYAINYSLLKRATEDLQEQPLNMVAENGRSFINPLVGAIHNTTQKLMAIIGDLGLSPVSVAKLAIQPAKQADPLADFAAKWRK